MIGFQWLLTQLGNNKTDLLLDMNNAQALSLLDYTDLAAWQTWQISPL
jgi:hypothetical protein